MRGTGYAIGEILIFLAIAAIIGFLIGWLVFYRRTGQTSTQLSSVNPNHVKRLEERSQAVDAKLVRIEKRATALLESLAKTPRPGGPAAVGSVPEGEVAPASDPRPPAPAPAPAKETVAEDTAEADAPTALITMDDAEDQAEAVTDKATDTTDEAEDQAEAVTDKATDTTDEAEDQAEAVTDKATDTTDEAKDQAEAVTDKATDTAEEAEPDVNDYLSEADERISKLEETLDKLSEKLAEFGED